MAMWKVWRVLNPSKAQHAKTNKLMHKEEKPGRLLFVSQCDVPLDSNSAILTLEILADENLEKHGFAPTSLTM